MDNLDAGWEVVAISNFNFPPLLRPAFLQISTSDLCFVCNNTTVHTYDVHKGTITKHEYT